MIIVCAWVLFYYLPTSYSSNSNSYSHSDGYRTISSELFVLNISARAHLKKKTRFKDFIRHLSVHMYVFVRYVDKSVIIIPSSASFWSSLMSSSSIFSPSVYLYVSPTILVCGIISQSYQFKDVNQREACCRNFRAAKIIISSDLFVSFLLFLLLCDLYNKSSPSPHRIATVDIIYARNLEWADVAGASRNRNRKRISHIYNYHSSFLNYNFLSF